MTRITDEELAELERRGRAASAGPWEAEHHLEVFWIWTPGRDQIVAHLSENSAADARLIVAARNALPSLLAEVRRLRKAIAERERPATMAGVIPANVHKRGWRWRSVTSDTAFAPPFGTIRQCRACGCLVAGGPTACARCAEGGV